MGEPIARLQAWFLSNCDSDWEHSLGIEIATLDNPGWMVQVRLAGTRLEEREFREIRSEWKDPQRWLLCKVENRIFKAACGPLSLNAAIQIFVDWAEELP